MTWAQTKSLTFSSTPRATYLRAFKLSMRSITGTSSRPTTWPTRCARRTNTLRGYDCSPSGGVYEYMLEHIRAGRVEEALLPYARYDPRTFWDLFWVFAWEGNAHAIDWLCAHIVPQLLPQQEPFCRRALQAIIDTPWRDTDAIAGEAVQTALLATHFTVYPTPSHLGADTRHTMRAGDFLPGSDGPWRVFLLRAVGPHPDWRVLLKPFQTQVFLAGDVIAVIYLFQRNVGVYSMACPKTWPDAVRKKPSHSDET